MELSCIDHAGSSEAASSTWTYNTKYLSVGFHAQSQSASLVCSAGGGGGIKA